MEQIKQLIVLIEQKNDEKLSSVLKDLKSIKDNNSLVDTDILKTLNEILNVSKTINKDDIEEIRNEVKTISESINKKQDNPLMEDLITAIKNIKIEQPSEISIKGMGKLKGATGEKGDKGDNGYTPIKGVDYFDGEKGEKGKDGSPDTPEQIVEKINTLENVIDIKTIKDFPVIEGTADIKRQMDTIGNQVLRLLSRPKTTGGGGGTWGSILGTLSNQTDLQNALNLKYDASNPAGYITSSALSGYTPTSRTITINGTTQDLSADRSWTIAVPTKTSDLTNDSGFITSSALSPYLPLTGATYATTTGNGLSLTTSTLTTGNLVSLTSTGTGAGSNTQTVLNIATSGANGTSSQTTYGAYVTNTHTGTTSTNVGLYVSASGATNNYGLIVANGNVGIGQTSPTARLHIAAGTASAETSPLKFTSGTNLTTPEAGAMEYDGTSLYFSPSTTRRTVVLDTATQTLTNKRINPRVQAVTSASTVTPSADNDDEVVITAQGAALTLANWSGTPVQGQAIIIRIKDDGTARAITFDTLYRAVGAYLPTTTVIGKTVYIACIYNSTDTKIDVVSVAQEI